MSSSVPRRPEVPGAPGISLPRSHGPGGSVREVGAARLLEDDMPTNPYSSPPPPSGRAERRGAERDTTPGDLQGRRTDSETRSLAIRNLTKTDAGQLAGIIAVWEASDTNDRRLLAEFAQRLASPPRKPRE